MGCCVSLSPEELAQRRVSKAIDKQLRADYGGFINIIVLSPQRKSGKSTIFKQMKILYGNGYSPQELQDFKPVIFGMLVSSMGELLRIMDDYSIDFTSPNCQEHSQVIRDLNKTFPTGTGIKLPPNAVEALTMLWEDDGVKECFRQTYDEYQLNNSAPYYFENIYRLLAPEYIPCELDVLRSRVHTTSFSAFSFKIKQLTYNIMDVGISGLRNRALRAYLDDIKVVFFVSDLSAYDVTGCEVETNQLEEALEAFPLILHTVPVFSRASVILFLNKMDLFRDKILNSDHHLRLYFPKYTGPDRDVDTAAHFILTEFLSSNQNVIYHHFSTAIDTSNLKMVMDDVLATITRVTLETIKLL